MPPSMPNHLPVSSVVAPRTSHGPRLRVVHASADGAPWRAVGQVPFDVLVDYAHNPSARVGGPSPDRKCPGGRAFCAVPVLPRPL